MNLDTPTNTVLYAIEETIKAYRKLSFKNIASVVKGITVDQALILIIIDKNELTQTELADLIFKDYASITRILNLMIQKEYIIKTTNKNDRRKTKIKITQKGINTIKMLNPVIKKNRETALRNISTHEQVKLYETLSKITQNCKF
ncbi:MarR family winged helix-turn-helix transcriptional regulator [Aquimarina longa]|uniref:MarR family winged helix-turn-helix transcriptional regulator n=1 Tax=Aquimarina longa TaxID=1080221 RepID=UPI00078373F6|nr:MarR family transcriptional regulator [Aquimarina longa]